MNKGVLGLVAISAVLGVAALFSVSNKAATAEEKLRNEVKQVLEQGQDLDLLLEPTAAGIKSPTGLTDPLPAPAPRPQPRNQGVVIPGFVF